jgi:hypothetical protein
MNIASSPNGFSAVHYQPARLFIMSTTSGRTTPTRILWSCNQLRNIGNYIVGSVSSVLVVIPGRIDCAPIANA